MPPKKRNKESESTDSDSGPDDLNPGATKKSKQESSAVNKKKSEEPKTEWVLDRNRLVKINEFRGKKMVDIREHFEKDGKLLPGKKGISLSILQWKKLVELSTDINKALDE